MYDCACCSSRSDRAPRKEPGEEGYDPYEYDDEGIDVGNEFYESLNNTCANE